MREEVHGTAWGQAPFKLLYDDWETLTANIWLPSLSELVGTTGNQEAGSGCYYSAMQGLNTSAWACVDSQGGNQFAYFKQYNTSGGGNTIRNACNQQVSWLRTPMQANDFAARTVESSTSISWDTDTPATASCAVHPAVETISRQFKQINA